ncbi:MAG: PilZ domain-containing protein [Gomphosphaeria aponina SAG 52.96 = DSM 107014]|uniref:PilZ domain-containing protein n=1 Tax=Gomphosphaeria aponina SAG 52.96 = DSM 107014 TaxID=1521640 RepID=A0A941GVQ7_9CHRO|nr:PilZ domain-containing protein [Gomphosphaeria aponina SAG 52.96 = DSM 107014]
MDERRKEQRILAVCKIFDQERNFSGFVLDINHEGVQIIVPKSFTESLEFSIIIPRMDEQNKPDLTVKIEQRWRSSVNGEYDKIGGRLIQIDHPEEFSKYLAYFEEKLQQYDLDL